MKLSIKNLGKIQEAEIDLEKNLLVFFGKNNTGKTFVSYCIYAISNQARTNLSDEEIDTFFKDADINIADLFLQKSIEVDFIKLFSGKFEIIKKAIESNYISILERTFGIYNKSFDNSRISISILQNEDTFFNFIKDFSFRLGGMGIKSGMIICKNISNSIVQLSIDEKSMNDIINESEKKGVINYIQRNLIEYKVDYSYRCIFIPAERIGISVFGRDVIVNQFNKSGIPIDGNELPRYSAVIRDAIAREFRSTPPQLPKEKNDYISLSQNLEETILNGKLKINESGAVLFDDLSVKDVSILNVASTIKSLSSLVFYLRYYARKNHVLIIDEPEVNLHPENQIKIARLLAKIANLGVKVIVSTHSDYIIREFNNLIMLGSSKKDKSKLLEKFNYSQDEIIFKEDVGTYLFEDGLVKSIQVNDDGFQVDSIDEVIIHQNNATNEIRWKLFEDEDE